MTSACSCAPPSRIRRNSAGGSWGLGNSSRCLRLQTSGRSSERERRRWRPCINSPLGRRPPVNGADARDEWRLEWGALMGPHQVWLHQERSWRLPNACGSPRFCAECALQERAQRIQRWRQAGTPEVGIFYVIAGELWLNSTPIPEARQLREAIIQSGNHRSYWTNLRR